MIRPLLTSAALALALSSAAVARPMTVDDYLRIQELEAVETSPTGALVAVSVTRASRPGDNYVARGHATPLLPPRNDLLVLSAKDGRVVMKVEGGADGGTAFSPLWSPGGEKLAFMRADRSGRISLRVWDAASGATTTVVDDGVRPSYPIIRSRGSARPALAFAWLGAGRIVFTRAGAPAGPRDDGASVRVWKSRDVPLCRPDDALAVASLSDGRITEVARGAIQGASISPDGSAMVVVRGRETIQPPPRSPLPAHRMPRGSGTTFLRWEASAFVRDGGAGWKPVGATEAGAGGMMEDSLPRWSADGRVWSVFDTPDVFAAERTSRIGHVALGGARLGSTSYETARAGLAALKAIGPNDVDPAAALAVVRARDGYATVLRAERGGHTVTLLELNAHLRDVTLPTPAAVDFTANGGPRKGWLFLPPGVARPPVVVTAYPLTRGMPAEYALTPEGSFPLLTELLGKGVAVYVADFRIQQPAPVTDEPTARVLSEIGANVEALKESGRVDPERMVFFGHSYGGYTAVNLIAHTDWFRGIIAAAPMGDLIGQAFQGGSDLDPYCGPSQVLAQQTLVEFLGASDMPPVNNLILKMGAPPYAALDKYVRNSPLLDMGKARTPSLIIQGSEDGYRDGERIFNTLYRLGVDAELLFYPGEGHILYDPANVRHMTRRSVDWTMEKLTTPPKSDR